MPVLDKEVHSLCALIYKEQNCNGFCWVLWIYVASEHSVSQGLMHNSNNECMYLNSFLSDYPETTYLSRNTYFGLFKKWQKYFIGNNLQCASWTTVSWSRGKRVLYKHVFKKHACCNDTFFDNVEAFQPFLNTKINDFILGNNTSSFIISSDSWCLRKILRGRRTWITVCSITLLVSNFHIKSCNSSLKETPYDCQNASEGAINH